MATNDGGGSEARAPSQLRLLEYVTIEGCADCRRFESLLARVAPEFPGVEVRHVPGDTARGMSLSVGRGVLRFPVIVLDDEIIGVEAISEPDLRAALALAEARR